MMGPGRRSLIVATLAVAPSATAQVAPQTPPVFDSKVEMVWVDAFVTRGGLHVPGLTAKDFELKDNGVRQQVELVSTGSVPLLAVLAFDTSGSVAGEKLAALQAAGEAFLGGLRPDDEAALLTFSEEIQWLAGPTRDKGSVWHALARLRAGGATAALDALYASLVLPKTEARHLVVLFSDGQDNLSWLGEGQVRAAALRSNALIHVVGLHESQVVVPGGRGQPLPVPEPHHVRTLRDIAEATGGRFWVADSPERIRSAFAALAEAMNQRYVLRYEPQNVKRQGWHRVELRVPGRKVDVQTRQGYWSSAR